ncbi:MAG: pitrilysin family protein [Chitinivibrionales bacterium]|nr:pitrilysin family protein [Chitinivibrionales bacterium]
MQNSEILSGIKEHTLSNGLTVICLKKNSAPIVAVQVWYRTGSINERDGIRGISHFCEHLMFRGSQHVKPEEHARRINDIGGHCNAFTSEDVTAYINSVPCRYLDMVLELEADRMSSLLINETILEVERNVIIEEYHTYMNNPVAKAFLEFRNDFFNGHAYAISPLGRLEDIRAIIAADCREYYKQWYTPRNAVLVVVGDIDSEQQVFDGAEKHFGAIAQSAALPEASGGGIIPRPQGQRLIKHKVEFDVPLIIVGYPAPASKDSDALPLEIMQLIISQGETSRLHQRIVRDKSIAVMVGGMNHCLRLAGMSLFFAAFTPDISAQKVERAILEEINIIKQKGVSAAEIEKIKNSTLTSRVFELYSAEHICQRIGFCEIVEGDYKHWVRRLTELAQLDGNKLQEAANRYWNEADRLTLHLQPKRINPAVVGAGIFRRLFGRFLKTA